MINCTLQNLKDRCFERGYTLDEVWPCVMEQTGDLLLVDIDHPAYPRNIKSNNETNSISGGPGTELKKLLANIGIKGTPNCSCNKRALLMDQNGIEWCENNMNIIIEWLKEEAHKRNLPFIETAAKLLIKRAIHNSKKNA